MAGKFVPNDIKEETEKSIEPRVVKLETQTDPVVSEFSFSNLKRHGQGDYKSYKSKFGPLAATDPERTKPQSSRDARFSLNSLLKDPLSINQEERRAIDAKVEERVKAMADKAKHDATRLGFEEGRKEGFQKAFDDFQAECQERLSSFDSFLQQAEMAKQEIFRANERFLIEMVFRIAKRLFLREVSADREYVVRLASELIERVGVKDHIRIGISPKETLTIEEVKEMLQTRIGDLRNLTVEVSAKVPSGGCLLETQFSAIDASLETQLSGIYESVFGVKPSPAAVATAIPPVPDSDGAPS